MPIPDITPSAEGSALQIQADDIVQALAKRNPGAARAVLERAGHIVSLVSQAVLSDADIARRVVDLDKAGTLNIIHEIASGFGERSRSAARSVLREDPERVQGTGLGEIIGRETGLARLADHTSAMRLEDWAGPVAEADEILASEGVRSEILEDWRRSRAVVEFSDRDGRAVYPSRQFSGRRPIPGLAEVQAIVGDPRSAWLWLVELNGDGTPSWLDHLRLGHAAEVLEAARQDFR